MYMYQQIHYMYILLFEEPCTAPLSISLTQCNINTRALNLFIRVPQRRPVSQPHW